MDAVSGAAVPAPDKECFGLGRRAVNENKRGEEQRMMKELTRLAALGFALAVAFPASEASAQDRTSIRIGWAISKTGPYTAGASVTVLPNYQVWVKDVNESGGIMLKDAGKKFPVEVIEYDDRSNSDEVIKAIERLATQDKVDFILPPWGTALNLAVGPVFHRLGYPQLAVTAVSDRIVELTKRWPNASFWTGTSAHIATSGIEVLAQARKDGKIGTKVALISVADQFGIELANAGREALNKAGFELIYDRSYPAGTQDMQPVMNEVIRTNPDVFIAYSYPTDSFAITDQAKLLNFTPKVFMIGVGAAFPGFKQKFGANVEGIMGTGGWNADSPALKAYLKRHSEVHGREPDRWASPLVYASLQTLQQAIERVGKIDRAAIINEIQTGTFDTIVGKIKLKDGINPDGWGVGQWQNGEFYGLGPVRLPGARAPMIPKPAWKP
jgi:branched-chain amino acid transport system substrate-binding protein